LKDFLISESRGDSHRGQEYSNEDRRALRIQDDTIHSHSGIRFNYTTYDARRGQDAISLKSGRDCTMTVTGDPTQQGPFWYARVLGIYHATVTDTGTGIRSLPKRVDFLWVWWFDRVSNEIGLPEIAYLPLSDNAAFSFVSPNDVIRACHVIPAFSKHRDVVLDGRNRIKRASFVQDEQGDWNSYYVNR
ncbi:hypothetical protein BOTBODRAFT_116703, partial [Botryobasidium botryosum FD-172 SS1]